MAILAIIFRLFLANCSEHISLTGLSEGLNEGLDGDTRHTSTEFLSCLLKDERYYGIKNGLT